MKRVIFFSHSQALGGAELSMLDIMARLDRDRFEPLLLAIGEGALSAKASGLGVKVLRAPIPAKLADWRRNENISRTVLGEVATSILRLGASLGRLKPAVIFTHSQKAHLLGGLAGHMAGMPVVWHAREIFQHSGFGKINTILSRRIPYRILCVSMAVARQFSGIGAKVRVVPNGIDADEIRRLADHGKGRRKGPGSARSSPLVGMVSRIAPGKGQHVFVSAAAHVSKRYPGARFLIIGGPLFGEEGYLRDLRQQAEGLGLGGRIRFTGHLDNPLPDMKRLDVMVHCPVAPEGFGRSVAEAMALGVPVAATRCGAIPELIEDGREGLLVEPGDEAGLARAVTRLLAEPGLGRRMAAGARAKIEQCCQMKKTMEAIEGLLESI